MAAFANKAELRSGVLAWLGFTRGEIPASTVNVWIDLAETDINRHTRLLNRQETTSLPVTVADAGVIGVPSSFVQFMELYVDATPRQRVLLRDIAQVRALQVALAAGPPKYAAMKGDSHFDVALILAPLPDTTYSVRLTYWNRATLSSDESSNSLLLTYPDVYLYGTLIHAEGYLGNDPRIPTWEDMYLEQIASIMLAEKVKQSSDQGLPV